MEVEKEMKKMPAHADFRRFTTHLAKTEPEWAAIDEQLKKLETWPRDKTTLDSAHVQLN